MTRTLLVPSILALIVAAPFLLSKSNTNQTGVRTGAAAYQADFGRSVNGMPSILPSSQSIGGQYPTGEPNPFYQASATVRSNGSSTSLNSQSAPIGNPKILSLDSLLWQAAGQGRGFNLTSAR